MKFDKIHDLFRFRWSIPILAEIHNQDGARFVYLLNRLNMSRSVLTYTIENLIRDGLIKRNPGYGHPLRPEYVLTTSGKKIAPFCQELFDCVQNNSAQRLLQSRWSFSILFLPLKKGKRFSELTALLAPITPRALSEELKQLVAEEYLQRAIIDDYPPMVLYRLTSKAKPFISIVKKYFPLFLE